MSNNKTHRSTKLIQYAFGMLLLLGGGQALASTAANHIVENTVRVDYQNSAGSDFDDSTSAIVTIDTIQVAPLVSYVGTKDALDVSVDINELMEATIYTATFELVSESNGPELYSLLGSQQNTFLDGNTDAVAIFGAVTDYNLAATTVAQDTTFTVTTTGSTTVAIQIPADSGASGTQTNGFVLAGGVGQQVVIDSSAETARYICDVVSATNANAGSSNLKETISVTDCYLATDGTQTVVAFNVDPGDPIYERLLVEMDITTDTVTLAGAPGTHDFNVLADTVVVPTTVPTSLSNPVGDVTFTIYANDVNIYKFVRNTTTAAVPAISPNNPYDALTVTGSNISGINATYYRSGGGITGLALTANGLSSQVVALPGDVLEYAILIVNNGGTASEVVITDNQSDTPFTNLNETLAVVYLMDDGNVTCGATTCTIDQNNGGAGTTGTLTDDALNTGDFGGIDTANASALGDDVLTVYAGVGGDDLAGGTGGSIAIGQASLVVYQVTVD